MFEHKDWDPMCSILERLLSFVSSFRLDHLCQTWRSDSPLKSVTSAAGFASGATQMTTYFLPATQDVAVSTSKYGCDEGTVWEKI